MIRRRRRRRQADRPDPRDTKVLESDGPIIGYELGDGAFVKLENCCENPFECTKCFGPVAPWWAWWRRR